MSIAGVIAAVVRQDAPYQAEIAMGAQLICDFAGSRSGGRPYYWYRGTRYTRPEKIPGWSFSRATPGYAEDRAGNLIQFPANEPRITDKGLLLEEARTNSIRNSVATNGAVPGSPGTAPNNWSVFASGLGLSSSIVGTGTDAVLGLPYVDVRLFGTASGSQDCQILFEGTTSVTASNGQAWALSAYVGVVGGSTAGIGALRLGADQYNAGAYLGSVASTVISPSSQLSRFANLFTTTNAATTHVRPFLSLARSGAGVAIDVTLRLAAPGLELGASMSSPIVTSGSVATRAADLATINGQAVILGQFRTNKVAIYNANPTNLAGVSKAGDAAATLSLVNDASALSAAGLSGVVTGGQVFKLDNSAGSGVAVAYASGATGSTANHTYSSWVRGSGVASVISSDASGATNSLTANYARMSSTSANSTGSAWSIRVGAGAVAYFILPQVEEGGAATEVIVTQGAPASAGNPVTLAAAANYYAASGVSVRLVSAHDGTALNVAQIAKSGAGQVVGQIGVSSVVQTSSGPAVSGLVTSKAALRVRPTDFNFAAEGARYGPIAGVAPPLARIDIGSQGSGNQLNGYVQSVMVLGDVTDAQLQRLAA